MKYTNEQCPVCGEIFKDSDDVVVCPVCGTPHHRECWQKTGKCSNEEKHSEGFLWTPSGKPAVNSPEQKMPDEKMELVCPACGFVNAPGSEKCARCGQKFTVFGKNVVQLQAQLKNESAKEESVHDDPNTMTVDKLINIRVDALAPGITPEQKKEPLCGKTIVQTIGFVGSNASCYVNKFRKIERERRHTFNWGAFFFSPIWFFYRKLIKPGIIFLTLHVALSLLMLNPYENLLNFVGSFTQESLNAMTAAQLEQFASDYMSLAYPVIAIGIARFVLSIICGFTADKLYHTYCQNSLNEIDTLKAHDEDGAVGMFLKRSSISFLYALICSLIYSGLPSLVMMLLSNI